MYSREDHAVYKKFRNRIRKYPVLEILDCLVSQLLQSERDNAADRHPWWLRLLIKWTLLDGEYGLAKKKMREGDCPKLIRELFDELDNVLRRGGSPTSRCEAFLFWRRLAFQQWPFQYAFDKSRLGRQYALFGSLPSGHWMREEFRAATGVEIKDFVELELVTAARFF